jgi:hypothetical protein
MQHTFLRSILGLGLISSAVAARLSAQEHRHPPGQPTADLTAPPLYDNLGTLHKEITTRLPVAQQYFGQGLRLTFREDLIQRPENGW